MTRETHPFPGLFGGVSQQIPAMRHPTQCAAQDNGIATTTDGLYKRNGLKQVAYLPFAGPNQGSVAGSAGSAHGHTIDLGPATGYYQLLIVNGSLCVYDMTTGAAQDISMPNGSAYLAGTALSDFRCVTVADYTFIVNRTKVPALTSATSTANPTNVAYINVRTAAGGVIYSANVNGIQVSITSATTTTVAAIAEQLRAALAAALSGYTVFIIPDTNIIKVTKVSTVITCSVSDGWSNTGLQSLTNGVPKYSDLPPAFETGYVLTVNGTADAPVQPYYVRWDGKKWVETLKPGLSTTLDPTTLPHQLIRNSNGTWTFKQGTWDTRLVGDDTSVPLPSFVGTKINNVFFYRNRLGFLAGDSVILSRPGNYFNFFPSSGSQVLATDPIDLAAISENVLNLEWVTNYNDSLIVWSGQRQQYSLVSGQVLSPEDCKLQPTTTFDCSDTAKPLTIGNKVFFLSRSGNFIQAHMYRVSPDTVTNWADDLTRHVPNYITTGFARHMAHSPAARAVIVVPGGTTKYLFGFRYELDEADQMTQKAWSRFNLGTTDGARIVGAYWIGRTLMLTVWLEAPADSAGGRYALWSLEMDETIKDSGCDVNLRLDQKATCTVGSFSGGNTTVTVPYLASAGQLTYLQCATGVEPIAMTPISETPDVANLRTIVVLPGDRTGYVVWAGRKFDFTYTFTESLLRDSNGAPIMSAAVKLVRIIVKYVKTGWFKATVTPLLRGTYEYPMDGRIVGRPGQGATQIALSDGELSIPVHTKAPEVKVSITSDSYLPVLLPYAEWVGDVTYKAARR